MSDEADLNPEKAWDADDPRRQADGFAPPKEPCECTCLHCGRTFSSDAIWFQRIINGKPGDLDGYWMCPTNNCGGAGFTFDIFPTDPAHPANEGWHSFDDDDDDDDDEEQDESSEADDEFDDADDDNAFEEDSSGGDSALLEPEDDIPFGDSQDDDDDVIEEGDEWKLGYAPDQPAPASIYGTSDMRAEQAKYDEPDERPRVIDRADDPPEEYRGSMDDIPF